MLDQENIMRVTIHAAYLGPDERGTPPWGLMLQKVARTIEQFEEKGWQARDVSQDDTAATITFYRVQQADAEAGTG